jgi:diguanylate cyclase (GGDEF)-like protein
LRNSAYTDVVRAGDLGDGSRPDLIPEEHLEDDASGTATRVGALPPAVWDYHRPGMEQPQCLEYHQPTGKALLNGQTLTDDETKQLLQNLDDGTAVLRYRGTAALPGVAKMESALSGLMKADGDNGDLFGVMQKLKELQGAGHLSPEELQSLHRGLYGDQMVPSIGNKRAYKDFLSRPRPGVHVMMDANDFKAINDELGHDTGDKAISHMGAAMREAMDETVGREHGKLFRFGGDEFAAHVPTYEHAAQFSRALRSKLEAVPPLGGTHRLSVSLGLGHDPETADQALNIHAKGAKNAAIQSLSTTAGKKVRAPEAMYAHSLYPGHEGAIPNAKPLDVTAATLKSPHEETPHVSAVPAAKPASQP